MGVRGVEEGGVRHNREEGVNRLQAADTLFHIRPKAPDTPCRILNSPSL